MRNPTAIIVLVILTLSSISLTGIKAETRADWTDPVLFSDSTVQWLGSTYGMNIIHYSSEDMSISNNGGGDWKNVYVETFSRYCLGPSNIHRVTMSEDEPFYLAYSRSANNGSSWTYERPVFELEGDNDGAFGIGYFGGSFLIYSYDYDEEMGDKIVVSKSIDNGMEWSDPVTAVSNIYVIDPFPNNIVECNGDLFIAYFDIVDYENSEANIFVIKSSDLGETWSDPVEVAKNGYDPQIVSDAGKLYLTYFSYLEEPGIKITKSDDGETWEEPIIVGSIELEDDLSSIHGLAVRSGNIFVAYNDLVTPTSESLTCKMNVSYDDGAKWADAGNVTQSAKDNCIPSMLITGGTLHLFWIEVNEDWEGSTYYRSYVFDESQNGMDTDGDGYTDQQDMFPYDRKEQKDSDRDGIGDNSDQFPDDPSEWRDRDGDGVGDNADGFPEDPTKWKRDSDGDGVADLDDEFPHDPLEWNDTDEDGYGDNGDDFPEDPTEWTDTDSDGWGDNKDRFPSNSTEWMDTDFDGYGDNSDRFPDNGSEWVDTDSDGYGDNSDSYPKDPLEWKDTDKDGYGDNRDRFPDNDKEWTDTDSDKWGDNSDKFPNDPSEWNDTDSDGYGDNRDRFPDDENEWNDTDLDGYGDNRDRFPDDGTEWNDTDMDGYGDKRDRFPSDINEWNDTDSDGVGDNSDDFPADPKETKDTDDDGIGDNGDAFPNDPNETMDTDKDGTGDNSDAFPADPAAAVDTDKDGHPDRWNAGKDQKDSTTGLKIDEYPTDAKRWKEEEKKFSFLIPLIVIIAILIIVIIGTVLFIVLRKKGSKTETLEGPSSEVEKDVIEEDQHGMTGSPPDSSPPVKTEQVDSGTLKQDVEPPI